MSSIVRAINAISPEFAKRAAMYLYPDEFEEMFNRDFEFILPRYAENWIRCPLGEMSEQQKEMAAKIACKIALANARDNLYQLCLHGVPLNGETGSTPASGDGVGVVDFKL